MDVKDFKLDQNGDLLIKNGDFNISESDQTHINHILKSNKGYWFENPLLGVGIIYELNGSKTRQELKQTIRRQLVFDGFTVDAISVARDYQININAKRIL